MDSLLLENIKNTMVYLRNNPEDKNLCQMVQAVKSSVINGNNNCHYIEQFICDSCDILTEAYVNGRIMLVYDIADMLQGIPELKYWELKKNMYYYWKDYIKPVKIKWNLLVFNKYNPWKVFSRNIFARWK